VCDYIYDSERKGMMVHKEMAKHAGQDDETVMVGITDYYSYPEKHARHTVAGDQKTIWNKNPKHDIPRKRENE
jgi:hypothetical protein